MAIPIVTHLPNMQHLFVDRLSGLQINYKGSPIVEGAGRRYFEERIRANGIGRRFLLLTPGGDADAGAKSLQAEFSDALELGTSTTGELLLIRPDGYVACESSAADAAGFEAARAVLGRQLTVASKRGLLVE